MKKTKTITLNGSLLEWIQEQIKKKRFASVSHAIEYALTKLRESET